MFDVDNYEVTTTTDKSQRDRMFEDLHQNGNELERQVVKFSSNEPVLDATGQHAFKVVSPHASKGKPQIRWMYCSTWSVAYPRS